MIRFILYAILIYLLFRFIRILVRLFSSSGGQKQQRDYSHFSKEEPKTKIKKEDVIDAEFEEINDKEKENSKN